jgi:hypothetical protein
MSEFAYLLESDCANRGVVLDELDLGLTLDGGQLSGAASDSHWRPLPVGRPARPFVASASS